MPAAPLELAFTIGMEEVETILEHALHIHPNPNVTSVESPELPNNGGTVIVGIIMGLVASVGAAHLVLAACCHVSETRALDPITGINLGNNLQALGLSQQTSQNLPKKPLAFWLGTAMFALSSIINFAAFPFAPAAVLAPLESIQFVSNLLFARFVNKREITAKMYIGSSLIIGGTVLTVSFGPNQVIEFSNLDEIADLWTKPPWQLYAIFAGSLGLVALRVYKRLEAQPGL